MSGIERVCLSVNSICNLRCSYCYFFLEPDRLPQPDALSTDEIFTILSNVDCYGQRPEIDKRIKVNFVGSGEPLVSWAAIRDAIVRLNRESPNHRLRFYTVTNGLLLDAKIVSEMKSLNLSPSISLDGPASLHDSTRLRHNGKGSHADVMRGIDALRAGGIPIAINTTLGRDVVLNLDTYFDFIEEQGFDKIIFGCLVDVPPDAAISTEEFYWALQRIAEIKQERKLDHIEIGNLEAYSRALDGKPDRVCTMFGSTCGAGYYNIIYMQRDVYPCGRMFGQEQWKLGRFDEPLDLFPARMAAIVGRMRCEDHQQVAMDGPAGPDCLIERQSSTYSSKARDQFVQWLAA